MNPSNGIIGDSNLGIDLPEITLDEKDLKVEKEMANFSKSSEFKRIQKHCEERIKFYQTYLPNGAEIGLDVAPSPEDWRVANRVIGELNLLINMYQTAVEAVEEANAEL